VSQVLIHRYLNDLSDLKRASGTHRETVVREAFKSLLKGWGRSRDLIFVPEYEISTVGKQRRYVDGALVDQSRLPLGFWEAKDEQDNLSDEIDAKFRRGYPQDNIIFEDSREAILIQNKKPIIRCDVHQVDVLEKLLKKFFLYESPLSTRFKKAVDQFKVDLPDVLETLRSMIDVSFDRNELFRRSAARFLIHAKSTIHPDVSAADVREMLIQHVLTEDIFSKVFGQDEFHRKNNIAQALYKLEATFFTGDVKWQTLNKLAPYYAAIHSAAAEIRNHHEKQTFLKVIYQNFYQVYNKKLADRLGVVYTPNEIVRFIIEGADWLCDRHFSKKLIDRNVEILEPAAGTGTFVTELIEYFRGQPAKLKHKYLEEIHANEVAILPYYVANLNIETTFAILANEYVEFPNLCFVDTLDSVEGLGKNAGIQRDLFGAVSEENYARIKRQNKRKISVVIGNPPYNSNQVNENDNNRNREYPAVDKRIRDTYIAQSSAQKTKRYDMYSRFFRWASDRIDENGIVAFITNRNFIDSRDADGFRKIVAEDFNDVYIVDLGGDVRADPRLSGTKHNVFGIQTGVAISFMVKRAGGVGCRIRYTRRPPLETAEEKLSFLANSSLSTIPLDEIVPSKSHDWLNQVSNDFDGLIPLATKETKNARSPSQERAVFRLVANAIKTNRDEWVYAADRKTLEAKMKFFLAQLGAQIKKGSLNADTLDYSIKWSSSLKTRKSAPPFSKSLMVESIVRPFVKSVFYADPNLSDRLTDNHVVAFGAGLTKANPSIYFVSGSRLEFCVFASDIPVNYALLSLDPVQFVPRFRFSADGERIDNITDWALQEFRREYKSNKITKDQIFQYAYGILHNPSYRKTYSINLKRGFPRLPYYSNFPRWSLWGKQLLDLHIGFESATAWNLRRIDVIDKTARASGVSPLSLLRADKEKGIVYLNGETQLIGIPPQAWEYRLGNRSALEWVLDQYSEKTPKDPTIRAKFDTYRFSNYKEYVIDLIKRITTVSVRTQEIVDEMRAIEVK
jgi:predicted helicase